MNSSGCLRGHPVSGDHPTVQNRGYFYFTQCMVFVAKVFYFLLFSPITTNSSFFITRYIKLHLHGVKSIADAQSGIIDFLSANVGMPHILGFKGIIHRLPHQLVQSGVCLIMSGFPHALDGGFEISAAETDLLSGRKYRLFPLISKIRLEPLCQVPGFFELRHNAGVDLHHRDRCGVRSSSFSPGKRGHRLITEFMAVAGNLASGFSVGRGIQRDAFFLIEVGKDLRHSLGVHFR